MLPETHACEAVPLCRIQLLTPVTDSIAAQSLGAQGRKKNTFFHNVSRYGGETLQLARHGNRFNSKIKHYTSKIWQPDVTAGVTW